ncbi:MAG: hypothetical protein J7M25_15505 [Deltaproteobacteria bacterium]|nr:hypothetical protein [Deltaproteobacteria bacterium]
MQSGRGYEVSAAGTTVASSISLDTESVNLKSYFDEGFDVEIEVQPKTCLRDDVTFLRDDVTFVVDSTVSLYV